MITLANVLALMGMAAIRFGVRFSGGFVFTLFGLMVVGAVVWALTRPVANTTPVSGARPAGSSPAAGTQE
jgi:hypothetical protein